MDLKTLARAYDRSAAEYDERFRALQRPKYEAAVRLLGGLSRMRCLDAGGGTGLFAEVAPQLELTVLDVSVEMLRIARGRGLRCVQADLSAPPLRARSFPLVVSFTAVLAQAPRALRALGELTARDLVVSFLADEAPAAADVARCAGLTLANAPVRAGQDRVFHVRRDP